MSEYISWNQIYKTFGILILILPILLIFIHYFKKNFRSLSKLKAHEDIQLDEQDIISNEQNFLIKILKPIGSLKFILTVLIFLIFYRLPDDLLNVMINPFLLHLGYSAGQIAT